MSAPQIWGLTSHVVKLPDDAPKSEFTLRIRFSGSAETKDLKVL